MLPPPRYQLKKLYLVLRRCTLAVDSGGSSVGIHGTACNLKVNNKKLKLILQVYCVMEIQKCLRKVCNMEVRLLLNEFWRSRDFVN